MDEIVVEFDGMQVRIRTSVTGVKDFVRETYSAMLVIGATNLAGEIEVQRQAGKFVIYSKEILRFEGDDVEPLFQHIEDEVLLHFIRARRDLLWLHAGAVVRDERALLVIGASGSGKSSLSTGLAERGWQLMSDDIVPIRMDSDSAMSFPSRPSRRIFPGREMKAHEIGDIKREVVKLSDSKVFRGTCLIGAIVFPEFIANHSVDVLRVSHGNVALDILRHARNVSDHREAAILRAARLSLALPAFRIRYSDRNKAVAICETLL